MNFTLNKKSKKWITLPYVDDFFLSIQVNNFSQETLYNYERDLMVFQNFLIKEMQLTDFQKITKQTIQQYKAYLTSRDRRTASGDLNKKFLSSYSINRLLCSLRGYFRYLISMDYHSPLSPDAVLLVKTEKKHPHIAEMKEMVRLIASPTHLEKDKRVGMRNRAMLEVLFATGMRISELLSLKRSQIDESGRIFIMGKGKKQRFVYMTPRAYQVVQQYLATRRDEGGALFIPYRGQNVGEQEKNISTNYLQYKIKQYRQQLRINVPISAHSLRHGFATYMAEQGANPAALQHLLGHESLNTTTRYVHASDKYAESTHRKFHPLKK